MTTRPDHHEALDAEERDLAARLGRVGPFEGPSPALDARILAAAHAAATTRQPRRHRRLAWLGVPPALVTGVGVAAAAVLALGLVWQLRPQSGGVMTRQEADSGDEMIIMVEPPAAARAPSAPPSPSEPSASTDSALPGKRTARIADMATPKATAKAEAAVPAPTAPPAVIADEAGTLAAQAAPEEKRVMEVAADDAASASGFVAEPPSAGSASPARKNHATYTTAARATAERRERASNTAAAAPEADSSQAESTTHDRIEVTGSRIRTADIDWSQVPVSDDTRLAAAEWLERIRARHEGEDVDNARASLKLFKREYPRVRIPDDLRSLLTADASR